MRIASITCTALLTLVMVPLAGMAQANDPTQFLATFEKEARQADPAFKGFVAERGAQLFKQPHSGEWSCASCHTTTPTAPGKHAKTGKVIAALAPRADPQRFTSPAKVEKWFARNCNDVLGRPCRAQEKGDVLAWLISLGK